jgi:ribosomal protein L11 methyltransferase
MNYFEYEIAIENVEQGEILIAELGELGFDSFVEEESLLKAYIPENLHNEKEIDSFLKEKHSGKFTFKYVEQENWNSTWEASFNPIEIAGKCYVRASFHEEKPEFKYELVIDPKMAFGTGHHETTSLVIEKMLAMDFADKSVLDMGCGTGILAILASKMKALTTVAIDNDPLCIENSLHNISVNNVSNIVCLLGTSESLSDSLNFDIILANITRNILLHDLPIYAKHLKAKGELLMSGFFEEDIPLLKEKALSVGLTFVESKSLTKWSCVKFTKA